MTIDKNAFQILETLTRMINSAYNGTLLEKYGTEHMLIFENIMELAESISYEDFMGFYNNNSSFYKIHLCDIIQQKPTADKGRCLIIAGFGKGIFATGFG